MKLTFACLLGLAFLALTTASPQYVTLTQPQIDANFQFLMSLREYGKGYVIQKGVFESPKVKLPDLHYNFFDIEKIERKSTTEAAFYRFTFLLTDQQNQARARITFTIRFDHRNGAFIVSYWRYTILRKGGNNNGWADYIPLDVRSFNDGSSGELDAFNARVQEVVASLIEVNKIPDSTYSVSFVYYGFQYAGSVGKCFYLKILNTEGEYFRISFSYATPPAKTVGSFYGFQKNYDWIMV